MKATRKTESTITLTMPLDEYAEILRGLGATSTTTRMEAGMSHRQARLTGDLYFAMSDAVIAS